MNESNASVFQCRRSIRPARFQFIFLDTLNCPRRPQPPAWWVLFSVTNVNLCVSVCPHSNRKTTSAINAKVCRDIAYGRTYLCTDPEVEMSRDGQNAWVCIPLHIFLHCVWKNDTDLVCYNSWSSITDFDNFWSKCCWVSKVPNHYLFFHFPLTQHLKCTIFVFPCFPR